jgi:hypothetical protein
VKERKCSLSLSLSLSLPLSAKKERKLSVHELENMIVFYALLILQVGVDRSRRKVFERRYGKTFCS